MEEIKAFMDTQYDHKLYTVREHYRFWSTLQRKPGETIQELAARIWQDAATCDFPSIQDPLDEALRKRFICSVDHEAVLKALFKVTDEELTFSKAVKIALETEEASKAAKETVHGSKQTPVFKVRQDNKTPKAKQQLHSKPTANSGSSTSTVCMRCGKKNHKAPECRFKDADCNYCHKRGHIEAACLQKKKQTAKLYIYLNKQRLQLTPSVKLAHQHYRYR